MSELTLKWGTLKAWDFSGNERAKSYVLGYGSRDGQKGGG